MDPQLQQLQPGKTRRGKHVHWVRWTVVSLVLTAVFAIAVFFILKFVGIQQGVTFLTIISIIAGIVFGLLGFMLSLLQYYYPRTSTHPISSTASVPTSHVTPPTEYTLSPGYSNDPAPSSSHTIPTSILDITMQAAHVRETSQYQASKEDVNTNQGSHHDPPYIDWGEAPHPQQFYGRDQDHTTLEQWILGDHCRIVAVVGIGGIGKTALAAKLIEQLRDQFIYIFWRSLQNAPPLENVLEKCILFLSNQQNMNLPKGIDDQISLLIEFLRKHRCLLIFDNFETVLQSGSQAGIYREGYDSYGSLLQRIGASNHQSCLLLTSREKPKEIAHVEGKNAPVRSLQLAGLGEEGLKILKQKDLVGPDEACFSLIQLYSGNPLALQIVSQSVLEVFGGNVTEFLKKKEFVISDIYNLLDQQFLRLSELEREIMYWLAIEHEAISSATLQEDLVHQTSKRTLLGALESLRRRYMIESSGSDLFHLQPVILEYVTDRFIEQASIEFDTEMMGLISSHAFIKAQAKDYVRQSQTRLILIPIVERLLSVLGKERIEKRLKNILSSLHDTSPQISSYAAGNALNLLIRLKSDLCGYDFSSQAVRQAYLKDVSLLDVNFAHADLATCVFTEIFGGILCVTFSPNGEVIAAGTTNDEILLWQSASGLPLDTYQGHTNWVCSVAFSPDGRTLISGSSDRTVRLWNTSNGQLLKILLGHTSDIESVLYSPEGRMLASGSNDQTVRIWDAYSGDLLRTLQHGGEIKAIAFSPDSSILACGGQDRIIYLWNVHTAQILKTLQGHSGRVRSIAFSPDGISLVSGSDDQTLRLWDVSSGQLLRNMHGHNHWIWSVTFDQGGNMLASGGEDQIVRVWNAQTGQLFKLSMATTVGFGRLPSTQITEYWPAEAKIKPSASGMRRPVSL